MKRRIVEHLMQRETWQISILQVSHSGQISQAMH